MKDRIDVNGNTAVHSLVKSTVEDIKLKQRVLKCLLEYGCSPGLCDMDGKLPKDCITADDPCFQILESTASHIEVIRKDHRLSTHHKVQHECVSLIANAVSKEDAPEIMKTMLEISEPVYEAYLHELCHLKRNLHLLLSGNERETSKIDLGAHQVVLVTKEETKKTVKSTFQKCLVLTIDCAKGLDQQENRRYKFDFTGTLQLHVSSFGYIRVEIRYYKN
uniref:Lupus brain antigen 1 n=1 Tax=Magallana gigas TaxID=29159 RepID=K1S010_MAGGI